MSRHCTVVVIGAGISGLAAAAELTRAGVDVSCLEARERIGGRLLSVRTAGGALDLGSTWFWAGEHRIEQLVRDLRVEVHAQHIEGAALEDHPDGPRRLRGNPMDVPSYRYTWGAQGVAEALALTLPPRVVQLGTAVSAIDSDGTALSVHTPSGQVRADHVVLAVPPALAVHLIEFYPGLPDRLLRLARSTPVWMGAMTKVVAQFPEPFWWADGLAGAAFSSIGPMRELHDMSGPEGRPAALFGFAPMSAGVSVAMEDEVVRQLIRLYGPHAAASTQVLVQNWSEEKYTSPPGVASLSAYQLFGHPMYAEPTLGGRLHWAATETARESPGHVEGALAGAERASAGVLEALGLPVRPGLTGPGSPAAP